MAWAEHRAYGRSKRGYVRVASNAADIGLCSRNNSIGMCNNSRGQVMVGQDKPALVALGARREMVIDALSTHFANDALDMDEFEQRVDLAHRATSVAELDELLTDLEPAAKEEPSESLVPQAEAPQGAIATRVHEAKRLLTILSSIQRKGTWRVPKKQRVVTVMGGVDLDFREARFGPGVTEVKVTSVMGGIAIIVPPHLQVECAGVGILGHFEGMDRSTGERDPDAPLLRITGVAVMGAVEISTRLPGEMMKVDASASVGQIGHR